MIRIGDVALTPSDNVYKEASDKVTEVFESGFRIGRAVGWGEIMGQLKALADQADTEKDKKRSKVLSDVIDKLFVMEEKYDTQHD